MSLRHADILPRPLTSPSSLKKSRAADAAAATLTLLLLLAPNRKGQRRRENGGAGPPRHPPELLLDLRCPAAAPRPNTRELGDAICTPPAFTLDHSVSQKSRWDFHSGRFYAGSLLPLLFLLLLITPGFLSWHLLRDESRLPCVSTTPGDKV